MAAEDCACGSGQKYRACCRPFHEGAEPPDPVTLMRSRFTAYARGDVAYLWRTTHSAHPDRAGGEHEFTAGIRRTRRANKFVRLRVLDHDETRVLFHAEVYETGKERSFLELSTFDRDPEAGGAWRYMSGELRAVKANDPSLEGMTIIGFALAT